MTQEQIQDIEQKLSLWREERKITLESQREDFEINMCEELREFYIAQKGRDEHGMIDALCDMVIVAINSGEYYFYTEDHKSLCEYSIEKNLDNLNLSLDKDMDYAMALMVNFGYDPYKCLLEKIKELNSRTQDEDQAKEWKRLKEENALTEAYGKWKEGFGAYTKEEALEALDKTFKGADYIRFEEENETHWIFAVYYADIKDEQKLKKWYCADYLKYKL